MSSAMGLALDTAILSNTAASVKQPAGILGTSAIAATANGGIAAVSKDISNLLAALTAAGGGIDPVFIASPATCGKLLSYIPQFKSNYPLLPSGVVAADTLIAVEAGGFVSAFQNGGLPDITVSNEGAVVLQDDDPAADIGAAVGAGGTVKSLLQADLVAVKIVLRCGWVLRSTTLAQSVTSVSW
jgi:hypothetical protein